MRARKNDDRLGGEPPCYPRVEQWRSLTLLHLLTILGLNSYSVHKSSDWRLSPREAVLRL